MRLRERGWYLVLRALGALRRHSGLVIVLAIALAARLLYLRWFRAFPAGDVYNFITIARSLLEGGYPADEKRFPGFPALILLARAFLDWEAAGLVVAVGASLAALALLYAIGRTLGATRTALGALLLLLQLNFPFFIASTRAYADTTLVMFSLAALLALLRARTWRGAVATGLLFAAAALTRYEGDALALALLPLWFLIPGRGTAGRFLSLRTRLLPALALATFALALLPYVAVSLANGRPPWGVGYLAEAPTDARRGAPDIRTFANQAQDIWRRNGLTEAWRVPVAVATEIAADPFGAHRRLADRLREPQDALVTLALLGFLSLLVRRRWWHAFVLLVATAALTAAPAWWEPLERYDTFVVPFPFLFAALGLTTVQHLLARGTAPDRWGAVNRAGGALVLFAVVAGLWIPHAAERIRDRQLKHNGRNYAYYQAIHAARRLSGTIAFPVDHLIVWIYFSGRAVIEPGPARGESAAAFLERLRARGVRYAVVASSRAAWEPIRADPTVQTVARYEWLQGDRDRNGAHILQITPAP